jgi:SRSO17 transposase
LPGRLYLPLEPTVDALRRAAAGITETVALEQIWAACAADLPRGAVLIDAGYGTDTALREAIGALGLSYIAGILPQTLVWGPGTAPLPPQVWSGRGCRAKLTPRCEHRPVSVKTLAQGLPAPAEMIFGREGTAGTLTSRFARFGCGRRIATTGGPSRDTRNGC